MLNRIKEKLESLINKPGKQESDNHPEKNLDQLALDILSYLDKNPSSQEQEFLIKVLKIIENEALEDPLKALKELLQETFKSLKPQDVLYLQDDKPLNIIYRKIASIVSPAKVNSLLAPGVDKADTFSNGFDTLLPGQFIIADDGVTFIHLEDFFKTAWEQIQNGERGVFNYANAKGQVRSISENEKAQIIQFVPKAQKFFRLTAEFQNEQKGSILSLLENLRLALSLGDRNGNRGGDELRAGPDANIGIAEFYKAWVLLPDDLKLTLRALRTSWGGQSLGYVLDHLFDPKNPTPLQEAAGEEQSTVYCIGGLGGILQSIIEGNRDDLRSLSTNPKFYQLQKIKDNIQNSLANPAINFICARQFEAAKVLIDENPNCLGKKSIMDSAIKYARVDFVSDLCKRKPGILGIEHLYKAIKVGQVAMIEFIAKNISWWRNSIDAQGRSPLLCAAANGRLNAVDYFCKKGLDLNDTVNKPQSPLHNKNCLELAIINGHSDVVQYFLLKGIPLRSLTPDPERLNVPDSLSIETKLWQSVAKELGSNFIPSVYEAHNKDLAAASAFLKKIGKTVNFIIAQFKHLPEDSAKRVSLQFELQELRRCTTDQLLNAKLSEIRNIVAVHRDTGLKGFFALNLWRNTQGHKKFNDTFREELPHLIYTTTITPSRS